ncbi:MAG: sulfatase-like hydrolase/transferase [Sedimentisphaerales bacterium]|nr:sulfatase-like hydrolase/transferase [Sedimentisphaerales bacterium]
MNRRDFLKKIVLSTGAAVAAGTVPSTAVSLAGKTLSTRIGRKRPNVIYILADDLGYKELGCYGQKKIRTPNLDKLAAEGMRFTQHYSGQTVCAPSRCSLLTSKHMGHAYIRGNYEIDGYQLAIPDGQLTVAEIFKQTGYKTGAMGKWGLGAPDTEGHPNNQGFDLFYGNLGQVQAHWYYPPHLWRNDKRVFFEGNTNYSGTHYSHDYMAEEALQFITDNKNKPFFLYVPFLIPHVSLQVPQDSLDEYLPLGWPETPVPQGHYAACDTPRATYAAMITRMDRDIGRIMKLLKKYGIDDNTIVMFSCDNGTTPGSGVDHDFFDSVGPLRGFKSDLYEGGIRVPMIARWPGRIKPGSTTDHISAFWDFLPTCCDLIGAKIPDGIDGISFLSTLLGKPGQQQHDYLYWETANYRLPQQAVRMGKWKGLREDITANPNPPLELYDLDTDIGETTNVAGSNPDIVTQIEAIMTEAHTYSPEFPILYGET